MNKLTRGEVLIWAMGLAGSLTFSTLALLSKLFDDGAPLDAFRKKVFEALEFGGGIPFWATIFLILLMVLYSAGLAFYYNVVPQTGSILSKDGVLLFDREQHIAISVATLKSMFSTLAAETAKGRANELLYRAGESAGKRFGGAFKDIYITQIEPHSSKPWAKLNDNDKLDAWERYDATVGWGRISANKFENLSTVDVTFRHPTLYEGHGGELFSWLLAGYSKEVASALLDRSMRFDPQTGFVRDDGILHLHYEY